MIDLEVPPQPRRRRSPRGEWVTPCNDRRPGGRDLHFVNAIVAVSVILLLLIGAPLAIGAGLVFGIMASTGLSLAQLLG